MLNGKSATVLALHAGSRTVYRIKSKYIIGTTCHEEVLSLQSMIPPTR